MIINTIGAFSFIFTGVAFIIKFLQILLFYSITIRNWKEARGKITKYDIIPENKEVDYFGWGRNIEYEYIIDGKNYTNDSFTMNLRISLPNEESSKYFYSNKYKVGQEIVIYYNPRNQLFKTHSTHQVYYISFFQVYQ